MRKVKVNSYPCLVALPTETEPIVKKPAAEKIRTVLNKVVPILPKIRSQQQQQDVEQPLFSSGPSGWDPFVQHPPTMEPEVNLLMGTCKSNTVCCNLRIIC